ncbi:kinesin-like protein costa [Halyomorpha halys]|uniref:kinesin-like protein costa n=1 Tax=Halyomorpha halys TaxID=286706 RepID=UPI0006D4CAA0|nr:kinesin-like protein costa [Halyomorpha halys]
MLKPQNNESDVQMCSQELNFSSEERVRADSFSLEFATSQWQRLVSNAEGLFMTLVKQGIANDAREQIEQWLYLKQECTDCFTNDGSIIKEKTYSLDRIDEVTESDGKSSVKVSESETEYSDSGAEIDDAVDLSQVESKRHDFAEKLEFLLNKFSDKTEALVSNSIGPIKSLDVPVYHAAVQRSNFHLANSKRRKSILPSNPGDSEKFPPSVLDGTKKEFDLHASLTQSKKKLKKFLKQLRKEEEQNGSKTEESKRSKDKAKKSDKSSENDDLKSLKESKKQTIKPLQQIHQLSIKESKKEKSNRKSSANVLVGTNHCLSDKVLRDEITNLRITRDFLLEQRKKLDAKLNRDRTFSHCEERRFLELDEAIEAVDTTIEFKNGTICGRKSFEESDVDEGEQMLLDRLMKLSEPEMRFLLYKYFQKAIDLREFGKKMEQQIADLDHQIEAQAWKIQALSSALQQANAENERRLVMVHREHEEKLHLMFRHYTGTSSSADTKADEPRAVLPPTSSQNAIPQLSLRKLQGTSSPHTTKVTRQKKKLIIQQQTRK